MRLHLLGLLGLLLTSACNGGSAKDSHGGNGADSDTDADTDADTTAPTITLVSPLEGATLNATAALAATASDDVGVAAISFKIDGEELTSDDSDPYQASWDTTGLLNGNYVVSAVASDAAGNVTEVSAGVFVQNDGGASSSSVSMINPVDGSTICGQVSVEAAVSLTGATVVFSLDGTDIATDSGEPFTWDWNTESTSNGIHTVRATATGSDGLGAQSTISVDVENSGGSCDNLPSVIFTAPDASSHRYGSIDLAVDASDDAGVLKVQFFVDNGLLTEDGSIPYGAAWQSNDFDEGPHTLKAVAYDTASQTAETQITVTVDRTAPIVQIADPRDGSDVDGTVDVTAEVNDNLGLAQVEFYIDGARAAVVSSEPYTLSWDTTAESYGDHTIEVRATDLAGNTGSDRIDVTVDSPPMISITAPSDGSAVSSDVTVSATGSDDGGITNAKLYVDGALLSTDSAAPYSWIWATCEIGKGAHTLEVRATDGPHEATDSISVDSNQALEVELVSPTGTLDASETLVAFTSDDDAISKVVFDLDGTIIATERTTSGSGSACALTCSCDSYEANWDVSAVSEGIHTLTVTGTNSMGEVAADSYSVTVYRDADGDGYDGESWGGTDCDDTRASVNPAATETCASSDDDDCDGTANELDAPGCTTFYLDTDGDGFGDPLDTACYCSATGAYSALATFDFNGSYVVDTTGSDITWVSPSAGGIVFGYLDTTDILLAVESLGTAIDTVAAPGSDDAGTLEQYPCAYATDFDPASFAGSPAFAVGPMDAVLSTGGTPVALYSMTFAGSFASDGGSIEDVEITGLLDLAPISESAGTDLCSLLTIFGDSCVACPDGTVGCVEVDLIDPAAPWEDGLIVDPTVDPSTDPHCN